MRLHTYITGLEGLKNSILVQRDADMISGIIARIQSRCDDKYVKEGVALSSLLFADEMAAFVETLMVWAMILNSYKNMLDHIVPHIQAANSFTDVYERSCTRLRNADS